MKPPAEQPSVDALNEMVRQWPQTADPELRRFHQLQNFEKTRLFWN
jgi:hypothetical protein